MSTDTTIGERSFFYHQQRILWPLLVGIIAFFLAQNGVLPSKNCAISAFIAYVTSGLFYDWVIFNYLSYKDSAKLTLQQWQQHKVTPEQYDKLNEFIVMVRRCAFASSVSASAMCALFFPQASLMGTFFFAYTGITILFIGIGIITKEIVFKYTSDEVWKPAENNISNFSQVAIDPSSDNPSLNPLWYHRQTLLDTRTDYQIFSPNDHF